MPPVLSVSPVVLAAPGRGVDLEVRVSAPATGSALPVIVFAHGFGSNGDAYLPLAHYWAAHGFVVVQPTFLDARRIHLHPERWWRQRVADVRLVIDRLDELIAAVPTLAGRVARSKLAGVGHSFGAHTIGLLLGARVDEDMRDPRLQVGILLCAGGRGGADLSAFGAAQFPYLNQSYAAMTTPALIVWGDKDVSPLTTRGPDWFTDAFVDSPSPKSLARIAGGEHLLGGISGDRVTETTDEDPERVAEVQRITTAYLRSALYGEPLDIPLQHK